MYVDQPISIFNWSIIQAVSLVDLSAAAVEGVTEFTSILIPFSNLTASATVNVPLAISTSEDDGAASTVFA